MSIKRGEFQGAASQMDILEYDILRAMWEESKKHKRVDNSLSTKLNALGDAVTKDFFPDYQECISLWNGPLYDTSAKPSLETPASLRVVNLSTPISLRQKGSIPVGLFKSGTAGRIDANFLDDTDPSASFAISAVVGPVCAEADKGVLVKNQPIMLEDKQTAAEPADRVRMDIQKSPTAKLTGDNINSHMDFTPVTVNEKTKAIGDNEPPVTVSTVVGPPYVSEGADKVEARILVKQNPVVIDDQTMDIPKLADPVRTTAFKTILQNPEAWLNGDVINGYLDFIKVDKEDVKVFGTYFWSSLMRGGVYNYENVKRHNKRDPTELMNHRLIIIPIHSESESHWSLAVLFVSDRKFVYFDSFGKPGQAVWKNMQQYIADESGAFDTENWEMLPSTCTYIQKDGHSCGVYVLFVAKCVMNGACSWSVPFEFLQRDLNLFRTSLYDSLVERGFGEKRHANDDESFQKPSIKNPPPKKQRTETLCERTIDIIRSREESELLKNKDASNERDLFDLQSPNNNSLDVSVLLNQSMNQECSTFTRKIVQNMRFYKRVKSGLLILVNTGKMYVNTSKRTVFDQKALKNASEKEVKRVLTNFVKNFQGDPESFCGKMKSDIFDTDKKEEAWNVYNSGKRMIQIIEVLGVGAIYDGEAFGFLLGYKNQRLSEDGFGELLTSIGEMDVGRVYEKVGLLECLVAEFES